MTVENQDEDEDSLRVFPSTPDQDKDIGTKTNSKKTGADLEKKAPKDKKKQFDDLPSASRRNLPCPGEDGWSTEYPLIHIRG